MSVVSSVEITILVCTYNRANDLRELLVSALGQETDGLFKYEVLVVDNNSTDATREVVEGFIAEGETKLRYIFEGRQGKSYALNTGLAASRAALYTITDDDFILPPGWLGQIVKAFQEHPEVSFVSGKVLPIWKGTKPAWLTLQHWSAIAMADYGETQFYADTQHQICLLACAFRLEDVKAIGGYNSNLGVAGKRTGGTEDLDVLQRLWEKGHKGIYLPSIVLYHKVEPVRLTKAYHRKWHTDHGRQYALMRVEEVEKARARFFDVPVHLYKQALKDAFAWGKYTLQRKPSEGFWHETRLRFFFGFFSARRKEFMASGRHNTINEIGAFVRSLGKTVGKS